MTEPKQDAIHPLALWLRRRPKRGPTIGSLVFATGTVLGICLALKPQGKENPFLVLVVVWVIAGITQIPDRSYWRACVISGIGSALAYTIGVVAMLPNEAANNEMFGAGILEVGVFGFALSMAMGVPIRFYRRSRSTRMREGSIEH